MIKQYCEKHNINLKQYKIRKNFVLQVMKQKTLNNIKGMLKTEITELYNVHLLSKYGLLSAI